MSKYVRQARIQIWAKADHDKQILVPYSDADIVVFTGTNFPTTFHLVPYEWVEPGGAEGAHKVNLAKALRGMAYGDDEWQERFVAEGWRIEVWSKQHAGFLLDQHLGRVPVGQLRLPEE